MRSQASSRPADATASVGKRPPQLSRHSCRIFTCDVTLACCGVPAVGFGEVERRLRDLDRRFSRFREDSELSRLNASAGTWCDISPEMHSLLKHALRAAVASAGLVNIAVLPWLLAAGYRETVPDPDPPTLRNGSAGAIDPLTAVLELRRDQARLRPGHAVDLGALAKGLWADDVVSWLGSNSAASLGGDASCRGHGPDGLGWPVTITGDEVLRVVDGAVATSGTARRRWGDGLHHLIDPRTGQPSKSDIAHATVIASTGATAECTSSALVVGGTSVADRLTRQPEVLGWRLITTGELK